MKLLDRNICELETLLTEWGEPKYRSKQVFAWLHKGVQPEDMLNLPKTLRQRISEAPLGGAKIYDRRLSQKDGTVKYLFMLEDGNLIEGVLMHYSYGNTLCVSTQVGCPMGCAFCASTLEGLIRNLEPGEILGQVISAALDVGSVDGQRAITNVVLMGSGEPLMNFQNVIKFIQLISAPEGMNISPRNISLSTCGLVPKILELAQTKLPITLSISLHAPNDEIRRQIMPVARQYGINELLEAAKNYADTTGRRIIIEYALISGVNDRPEHAIELSRRLRGINCHVNLIPLNSVPERNLKGVSRTDAQKFAAELERLKISATVRREMGTDIEGACGQLRRRKINQESGLEE